MNKAELVAHVAKESDLSKDAAEKAVDATFKNIEKALRGGDTVRIVGFGNFQVAQRKASTGRNPRTGAEVKIPASRVPKFRAGKALNEAEPCFFKVRLRLYCFRTPLLYEPRWHRSTSSPSAL